MNTNNLAFGKPVEEIIRKRCSWRSYQSVYMKDDILKNINRILMIIFVISTIAYIRGVLSGNFYKKFFHSFLIPICVLLWNILQNKMHDPLSAIGYSYSYIPIIFLLFFWFYNLLQKFSSNDH